VKSRTGSPRLTTAPRGIWCGASSALAICILGSAALVACASKPKVAPPTRETQTVKPDLGEAAKYNVELGVAYMDRGDLALAKDRLERAEKEAPRDPMVHSALALLFERLEQPDDADHQFHTALRLAPHDPKIANNYAVYLCRNHRVDEGVKLLLETAHNPLYETPEAAYTNAAVCLRSVHRDAEAKANLLRAIALRPNFAEAVFQLASLEMQAGQLRDARARIDRFIEIYTATPDLLDLGVRISRSQGDPVGEHHYEQRLRVDFPDSQQTRALSQQSPNTG
jgi:type IV pilus assembly protein PilF